MKEIILICAGMVLGIMAVVGVILKAARDQAKTICEQRSRETD